jgi:hypothetical protein
MNLCDNTACNPRNKAFLTTLFEYYSYEKFLSYDTMCRFSTVPDHEARIGARLVR